MVRAYLDRALIGRLTTGASAAMDSLFAHPSLADVHRATYSLGDGRVVVQKQPGVAWMEIEV